MAQVVASSGTNGAKVFGGEKGKRSSSSLNDLVQSSKNLPKRLYDIDTLHLSLSEIQKRAYELRKYNKTGKDTNLYTKAHYLLIGKGLTIEEIENDIESLSKLAKSENKKLGNKSQATLYDSNKVLKASNLESYMYRQKDEDVLATIENSLSSAAKDFDLFVNKNINLDWKQKKKELCDKLSNVVKREPSITALSSPDKKIKKYTQKEHLEKKLIWGTHKSRSIISSNFNFSDVQSLKQLDSVVNPNISYSLRKKFELYAEVIYELNESRQDSKWYKLANVIASLYKSDLSINKTEQFYEACIILRDLCEDPNDNIDDVLRPNRFLQATYSNLTDTASMKLREKIVLKSRKFLESQFKDYLNELYSMNKTASLTELSKSNQDKFLIPNVDRVINFIELTMKTKQGKWKVQNMTFINGLPLWAMIFYLLRAGCYKEVVILVSKYEDSFQKIEKLFPFYLKSFCEAEDNKLSDELQGRLNNEFNKYFKNSNTEIDPFRYATYKLIGKCDLAKKTLPSIKLGIEDWLWLHLSLIKDDDYEEDTRNMNELNVDKYRLIDLQKNILEYGPETFNISSKNPMYLQTLLLVGLYEDAVKYLMYYNEIDSVHLAILLNYYGLIRISDEDLNPSFTNNLLNVDAKGFKSINYNRMMGNYIKKFKFSDPRVAAEYLFLLCLNDCNNGANDKQVEICQESIRDLVLETREFVLLLGKITKNGMRVPGIIEERKSLMNLKDEKSFLYNISEKAAQTANEDGRLIDCILLYQLSEEYDTVLTIINKLLGDFLNSVELINYKESIMKLLENIESSGDTNIIKLSDNLLKVYNSSPEILSNTSVKNRINCKKLLDIFEIIREFMMTNEEIENDFAGDLNNMCVSIMDKIKKLDLIPISSENDMSKVRNYINEFNNYDECIMKNIPNLLIIEMICLQRILNTLALSNSNNGAKIYELKQISKNCMIFAGLIKYKMPREMYSLLINLEINI